MKESAQNAKSNTENFLSLTECEAIPDSDERTSYFIANLLNNADELKNQASAKRYNLLLKLIADDLSRNFPKKTDGKNIL